MTNEDKELVRINWKTVFSQHFSAKGATEGDLQALVSTIWQPLSEREVQALVASQSNPFSIDDPLHISYKPFDPRNWRLPSRPLPSSYLDLLRWSNGGAFLSGDRRFDPLFSSSEVREMLLSYHVPQYMPGSLPFAFDGGGNFYLFDLREPSVEGEYPILFVGAGNLRYEDAVVIARSLADACRGTSDPNDLRMR